VPSADGDCIVVFALGGSRGASFDENCCLGFTSWKPEAPIDFAFSLGSESLFLSSDSESSFLPAEEVTVVLSRSLKVVGPFFSSFSSFTSCFSLSDPDSSSEPFLDFWEAFEAFDF
jgi:hypothetical protein